MAEEEGRRGRSRKMVGLWLCLGATRRCPVSAVVPCRVCFARAHEAAPAKVRANSRPSPVVETCTPLHL
jgi:hypothetical protein